MHTIKITPNLLFEYQCTSGKFIRLPNRIESKKNRFGSDIRIESKLFLPELECSTTGSDLSLWCQCSPQWRQLWQNCHDLNLQSAWNGCRGWNCTSETARGGTTSQFPMFHHLTEMMMLLALSLPLVLTLCILLATDRLTTDLMWSDVGAWWWPGNGGWYATTGRQQFWRWAGKCRWHTATCTHNRELECSTGHYNCVQSLTSIGTCRTDRYCIEALKSILTHF